MTPILGPETEAQITADNEYKFVSDKNKIAFEQVDPLDETQPMHTAVAVKHGMGEPVSYDTSALLVDDAGYLIRLRNGKLVFGGQSRSCVIRDKKNARENTGKLAQAILGKEVKTEEPIY